MHIFTAHDPTPLAKCRPIATLGVFDGVHLGHQAILRNLVGIARSEGVPSLAATFSTHPRLALGRSSPPSITPLETRLERLGEAGVDAVWILSFTAEMASLPARDFAEEYFHRRLDAKAVALGASARFGKDRDGDVHRLAEWSRAWDMTVVPVPSLAVDGAPVSSTRIRLAVQSGDLDLAAKLLGRRFSVTGTVIHGQGAAKAFGFPTINLDPHHELKPPPGVYLTAVDVDGVGRPSITNVGRPPTEMEIEAGVKDFLIETHLLDFDGDLYGRKAEVVFLKKTRDVMRFPDAEALKARVERDLAGARDYFKPGASM